VAEWVIICAWLSVCRLYRKLTTVHGLKQQRLDTGSKELYAMKVNADELEDHNTVLSARVKYVDKNMYDLEFLLEHAMQREEMALQREKHVLAALQQTKKSSDSALGQKHPHEIGRLEMHLNAAEQHCSALDGILRRGLNATQAKDNLLEILRHQLDSSEDQLQVHTPRVCLLPYFSFKINPAVQSSLFWWLVSCENFQ